jgi:hypothetical protein
MLIREFEILRRSLKERVRKVSDRATSQLGKEEAFAADLQTLDLNEPSDLIDVHFAIADEWWSGVVVKLGPFEEVEEKHIEVHAFVGDPI